MAGFQYALGRTDTSSIYYHTVEARLRKGVPEGDFARWIGHAAKAPELAAKIARVSPFSSNIEAMRKQLLALVRSAQRPAQEKAA